MSHILLVRFEFVGGPDMLFMINKINMLFVYLLNVVKSYGLDRPRSDEKSKAVLLHEG